MHIKLYIFVFIFFIFTSAYSQIPIEFQKGINNFTRTNTGLPGSSYWQNHSTYDINVKVNSSTRILEGSEEIHYYNESPDTLTNIVLRLYPNWNLPGKSRDWNIDTSMFTEGVKFDSFVIDKANINISDEKKFNVTGTNLFVSPDFPILPHSETTLYIKWSFQFPQKVNIRCGVYDETSYMVAYWYPQIAVYDDIDGWDKNDYTGMTEFYNDFSSYDVKISTDIENALIVSTGELQNAQEIFSDKFYEKYISSSSSSDISRLFDPRVMLREGNFKSTANQRVWHFTANSVPDFAFAFSDHYIWERSSVSNGDGKSVNINVLYKSDANNFDKVSGITQKLMDYFKNDLPGVAYPYPTISVFNGSGGMEYPMIVNDGASESYYGTVHVTSHEVSHTFFPFYMGTNERKYAWMDEGWAQYLPMDFQINLTGNDVGNDYAKNFIKYSGTLVDAPLLTLSTNLKYDSYRFNAYTKSWAMYDELRNLFGEDKFHSALKEYINRWNGKHPIPIDFMNTFENVYGNDLKWFWQKWMYDFAYCALSYSNYKYENGDASFNLKNDGGLPVHFNIKLSASNTEDKNVSYTSDIWKNGSTIKINIPYPVKPDKIEVSGKLFNPVIIFNN